ncbi:MAG: GNAT family N-acetyltransferase [Ilumatobacter sp.]
MRPASLRPAAQVSLRPWPLGDGIVHLVLLDVDMVPETSDVERWTRDAFADDIQLVRTGAMFPLAAQAFLDAGYTVADRLALLERPLIGRSDVSHHLVRGDWTLSRLRPRDRVAAADVDQSAFPTGWRHDADSLLDIAAATPQSHQRIAHSSRRSGRRCLGFSITGKAGTTGYLQRIAVHPSARRHGVATALVVDSLQWLMRRGAARAMVNTGIDNTAALALYEGLGFRRRDEELVVLERTRAT